jgi:hypothetical protein
MPAIPVVELGEYGHDKDPEQVQALETTVAYLKYQMLQGPEINCAAITGICIEQIANMLSVN